LTERSVERYIHFMNENKEVGQKPGEAAESHVPRKKAIAEGVWRVDCSCGWRSKEQDDGLAYVQEKDLPSIFTHSAMRDWERHAFPPAAVATPPPDTKPVVASDWRAPAYPVTRREHMGGGHWEDIDHPGVSKLTWLTGMIASGVAANSVSWDQCRGITPEIAGLIVSSAAELAKALDAVEAE